MKWVKKVCTASILGLLLTGLPVSKPAHAETEVLASDLPDLPVGTKLPDESEVSLPEGSTLRVLIVSSGITKTLKGPYNGTIEEYKEELTWWERIMGRHKEGDAPIGATRGFKAE